MKITIFAHKDHVFNYKMLEELLPKLQEEHVVKGVFFFPDKLAGYTGFNIYRFYLRTFGFYTFIKLACRVLISKCSFSSFDWLCRKYKVGLHYAQDPNDKDVVEWIKNNKIDVVLNFVGYIFKKDLLNAPQICALNKHAALLPAYRGLFPVFWTLLNGKNVGVSLHKMTEKIDAGNIIIQEKSSLSEFRGNKSVFDYYEEIFLRVPDLVLGSMKHLENGTRRICNEGLKSSYCGLPGREDFMRFKAKKLKFI